MNKKTPIDRLRESAFQMEIGAEDDRSAITAMLSIGDILYTVKEHGIYAVKLADTIDPERQNPHIPNTQQRVLAYGSESELVGRTLLTAKNLFNKTYLPPTFDCEQAIIKSFDALKDIVAMHEVMEAFQLAERAEIETFNNHQQSHGALIMPAIGDVLVRCKTFWQKADHASQSLFGIAKLFYGKDVGAEGFESLAKLAEKKYGKNDPFSKFASDVAPKFKYIRNIRNCLEHPHPPTQVAIVSDFNLGADGKVSPPMIEAVYRSERYSSIPISWFMTNAVAGLSEIFENMLAYLCSKHVQNIGGFSVQVMELSSDRRSDNKHVRFCYGILINGQIEPIG